MEVYVEDVFLDNFIIDALMLWATSKILHLNARWYKIALGAGVGVLCSLSTMVFSPTGWALFAFKFLCAALMVLCILPKKFALKHFFLGFGTFFALTFISGGILSAICLQNGGQLTENGQMVYSFSLPVWLVVGTLAATTFLATKIFKALKNKLRHDNFVFSAFASNGTKTLETRAFLDSGNTLVDPLTLKPIIFITLEEFSKLFKEVSLSEVVLKKQIQGLKNMHYISFNTVGHGGELLVFEIDSLSLKSGKKNINISQPTIALSMKNFGALGCGILFGPKALEGGNYEQI